MPVVFIEAPPGISEKIILRRPSASTGCPKKTHKHLKSTNVLERLNQELKRRTHVIRIFPNEAAAKPNGDDAG